MLGAFVIVVSLLPSYRRLLGCHVAASAVDDEAGAMPLISICDRFEVFGQNKASSCK